MPTDIDLRASSLSPGVCAYESAGLTVDDALTLWAGDAFTNLGGARP